ncbi:hypothetical protein J2852_003980 [Azospirillum soli]|nr:hypothetical protein [Azospirillum soli]
MLRLGSRVRHRGRDAMVIARTVCGTPSYDLRLIDGTIVKYAAADECELVPADAGRAPIYGAGRSGGLHPPT